MKAVQARTRTTLKNILFTTGFSQAADAAAPMAIETMVIRKGIFPPVVIRCPSDCGVGRARQSINGQRHDAQKD